jgi:AraC-like DNA-binding protein/mannose-6-phosphate isomerase-like protein (cupin superfamily)
MKPPPKSEQQSALSVWDTRYVPRGKAYPFYRDALCSVYMPWTTRSDYASEFDGRFESAITKGGTISRSRCSPMVCTRTPAELSHSEDECFYMLYVLSGYHACEQRGRTGRAGPGQIIVVDSGQPCRVEAGATPYAVIAITVPKADLKGIQGLEDKLANHVMTTRNPAAAPLFSCANLIAHQLNHCSQRELDALYDACVTLLPIAGGCFDDDHEEKCSTSRDRPLLRELQEFIDRQVADPELSARTAAGHFGISPRYVHVLFARLGTTFSTYVSATRLDHIRAELLSPNLDHQKISELAFRWGFNDLSSFNRSFRRAVI